jgi:hypothetical protein
LFRIGVQFRLYLLILCLAGTAASQPKRDLQTRVDSLVPGGTSLSQIQRLFGKPKSKQKVFEWWGGMRNGEFDGAYRKSSLETENAGHDHLVKRTLLAFDYPELKLVFSVFDNPWQLYSVTIQNPSVSVLGVRVGSSVGNIERLLGKGEWSYAEGGDYWWLTYQSRGVRFGFFRGSAVQKYPLSVYQRKVVLIEKFDNKVSFS